MKRIVIIIFTITLMASLLACDKNSAVTPSVTPTVSSEALPNISPSELPNISHPPETSLSPDTSEESPEASKNPEAPSESPDVTPETTPEIYGVRSEYIEERDSKLAEAFGIVPIHELAVLYPWQQALQDGCFVSINGKGENIGMLTSFAERFDFDEGCFLRVWSSQDEEDPVIMDIIYKDNMVTVIEDDTRSHTENGVSSGLEATRPLSRRVTVYEDYIPVLKDKGKSYELILNGTHEIVILSVLK